LTTHDVDELRKFVEAELAHELSERRNPHIVAQLVVPLPFGARLRTSLKQVVEPRLGIDDHRSKLQARKQGTVFPDALLSEEDRTGTAKFEEYDEKQQERRNRDQYYERNAKIEYADQVIVGANRAMRATETAAAYRADIRTVVEFGMSSPMETLARRIGDVRQR
jgi:hypothetical protein